MRGRALAARALETAAVEVRRGKDGRVWALVDRAVRRLTPEEDLMVAVVDGSARLARSPLHRVPEQATGTRQPVAGPTTGPRASRRGRELSLQNPMGQEAVAWGRLARTTVFPACAQACPLSSPGGSASMAHTAAVGSEATGRSSALRNTHQPSAATTAAASMTSDALPSPCCMANSDINTGYRPQPFPPSGCYHLHHHIRSIHCCTSGRPAASSPCWFQVERSRC